MILFFHTILEHVVNSDMAFNKNYQLLKRGEYRSHKVDLRKHFHIRDKCYLEFLKYPEKNWRFIGDTNRVKYSQYIKLIRKYKFEILDVKLQKTGPM